MFARPLDQVTIRPVDWVWRGVLAAGKLTILDGDPGLGKSLITLDLAARLTTGRPWPDGAAGSGPANAYVICAEDNDEDTIAPRLEALGADRARTFIWESAKPLPRLPKDIDILEDEIVRSAARLVVLDPILGMVDGSVNLGSDDSIRRLLDALARVAEERRAAFLMVRHLNKQAGGPALYRGAGGIAFSAVCRLGFLAARDPSDPARCLLAQHKNNLAPPQASLVYTVTRPESGPPRLDWVGTAPWTADRLCRRQPADSPRCDRARELLEELLKDGPRLVREILRAGRRHHLGRTTLYRARDQLKIRSECVPRCGRVISFWLLPGHALPAHLRGPEKLDLDPWLKPFEDDPAGVKGTPAA